MNAFYGWLSKEPPILYHQHHEAIADYLPPFPISRLVMYVWHASAETIAKYHRDESMKRPQDMLHHCINEEHIYRQVVARGVPASFISSNAMLDERLFTIESAPKKLFQAVYNARMATFKRHHLAANVSNLLMLFGTISPDDDAQYGEQIRRELKHATFVDTGRHWLTAQDVSCHLNQAHVGLCLSATEGSMWASTEYLLCGLPIVSTRSQGGRDALFDSRFVRIVADDAEAVARAVRDLIDLEISPNFIRSRTLDRMTEHRQRLVQLGQTIYSAHGVGRDFARDFYENFTNKLGNWRPLNQLQLYLESFPHQKIRD